MALLERVIEASSRPGDVVLDPFCGCGTAIEAAVTLERRWVGIDISNMAVDVIKKRMAKVGVAVRVFDWPTELDGVQRMVDGPDGRHRFEVWGLARLGLAANKRGGDKGIDGRISFTGPRGRLETIVVSVKSGHVGPGPVRDLKGTMSRERAVMGLIFTLEEPSAAARNEAVEAGIYRSPIDGREYPKIVIHTVRELLVDGRLPDLPTRHGIQEPIWPLPASTRSVRLRPVRRRPFPGQQPIEAFPDETKAGREGDAAAIRERDRAAALGPEAPRSTRTTTPGLADLPSPESADTD